MYMRDEVGERPGPARLACAPPPAPKSPHGPAPLSNLENSLSQTRLQSSGRETASESVMCFMEKSRVPAPLALTTGCPGCSPNLLDALFVFPASLKA